MSQNDLVLDVAMAMNDSNPQEWEYDDGDYSRGGFVAWENLDSYLDFVREGAGEYSTVFRQEDFIRAAQAAIAAARPHIRSAVFSELRSRAFGPSGCGLEIECDTGSFGGSEYLGTLDNWLVAQEEAMSAGTD